MRRKIMSVVLAVSMVVNFDAAMAAKRVDNIIDKENIVSNKTNAAWEDFTIEFGTYNNQKIKWRCVGSDENGKLMLSDDIICYKSFDAAYSGYFDSVRREYGSNYWEEACIKQWLNSLGTIEWDASTPSSSQIKGGNYYNLETGFLSCFTTEELSYVKEVTQKTYLNNFDSSVADGGDRKFDFDANSKPLSVLLEELTNVSDKWYKNTTEKFFLMGPEQLKMACDNVGQSYMEENESYWLRLPCNTGMSYENVAVLQSDGTIGNAKAYDSEIGIRVAFYLSDSYTGEFNSAFSMDTTVSKVKKLKVKSVNKKSYKRYSLSWEKVSDASGYEVYWCQKKKGTYKKASTAITNKCIVKSKNKKKKYYFKVRAYKTVDGKSYYGKYSSKVRK